MKTNPYTFTQTHPIPSVGVLLIESFGAIFGFCEHPLIAYNKRILSDNPGKVLSMEGKAIAHELNESYKQLVSE